MSVNESIVDAVKAMDDDKAKSVLADLLLNCDKVGKKGYTKEKFFDDCEQIKNEYAVNKLSGI